MAPGSRSNFGAPVFEPEAFRKQIYCIEESTCDIVGIFDAPAMIRHPHSDSAPGELWPPCLPRSAPGEVIYPSSQRENFPVDCPERLVFKTGR